MGKSLAEKFPVARRTFEEADDALGFAISRLCFEGPEDQLKLTENQQPALLTVSVAACAVLGERGLTPDFVAGHSLGEYSALVAAGSLRFADAVRLVRHRGRYMQEAVPPGVGAMAAILRLPEGKLDAILAEAAQGQVVSAANFNSPDQVVIAGHAGAVERAMALAKAAGARRAVPLPVSAPFHCALMKPAQERLRADLDATEFADLACPLVNNWQAREIRTGRRRARGPVPAGAEPRALGGERPPAGLERRGARLRIRRRFGAGRAGARHRSGHHRSESGRSGGFRYDRGVRRARPDWIWPERNRVTMSPWRKSAAGSGHDPARETTPKCYSRPACASMARNWRWVRMSIACAVSLPSRSYTKLFGMPSTWNVSFTLRPGSSRIG